jgi:hypothetical protein
MNLPVYDRLWLPHERTTCKNPKSGKEHELPEDDWRDLDHEEFVQREEHPPLAERIKRATAFLLKTPGTRQGNGASNKCLWLAGKLAWGFGLPEEVAVDLMMEHWARKEDQEDDCGGWYPWDPAQIRHKVRSAIRRPGGYPGVPGDMVHPYAGLSESMRKLIELRDQRAREEAHLEQPPTGQGTGVFGDRATTDAPNPETDRGTDDFGDRGAESQGERPAPEDPDDFADPPGKGKKVRESVAQRLVRWAREEAELIRGQDGATYARFQGRTLEIGGEDCSDWLLGMYAERAGKIPKADDVRDATRVLRYHARQQDHREVFVRIAPVDGRIYWDLGTQRWDAIEVTRDGWRVVASPPVVFRRTENTAPLPYPAQGGSLDDLYGVHEFHALRRT